MPDQYRLSFSNGTVLLDRRNDQVMLTIISIEGDQIERSDAEKFYDLTGLYYKVENWYKQPSETISDVLTELRSIEVVGNEPEY